MQFITRSSQEAFLGLLWVRTLESELSIGILTGKSGLQGPDPPEPFGLFYCWDFSIDTFYIYLQICNPGWTNGPDTTRYCYVRVWTSTSPDPLCPDAGSCVNGGTCWQQQCWCLPGYSGDLCEISVSYFFFVGIPLNFILYRSNIGDMQFKGMCILYSRQRKIKISQGNLGLTGVTHVD